MKLGVNTVLFKGVDVKTAMKAIKLAGYDGVELSAIQGMCEHLVLDAWVTQAPLVKAAAQEAGVELLSLTDHDTHAGCAAMAQAAKAEGLAFLPGVEVSTGEGGRVHVLGYGSAIFSQEMTAFLRAVASDRTQRARKILEKLDQEGLVIPQDRREALLQNPGVGRPHIARELIAIGAVNTVKQAFDRYLARGKCAYVPRQLPSTGETVKRMRGMGVVPVLAHPKLMELEWPALSAVVSELKQLGLMGLEAYHSSANTRLRSAALTPSLSRQVTANRTLPQRSQLIPMV